MLSPVLFVWIAASFSAWAGDAPADVEEQPVPRAEANDGATMSGNRDADMKKSLNGPGQNLFGGRLGTTSRFVVSFGFPHAVRAGFRFTWGVFEFDPHVSFDYGNPFGVDFDLGAGTGIGGRIHVFGSGAWDVALRFDVGVEGRFHPGRDLRLNLNLFDPGVRVSVNLDDVVDLDFGLDVLPQLRFRDRHDPSFAIAVPLMFGVEGDVAPGIQLGFTTRAGPAFGVGSPYIPTRPQVGPDPLRSVSPYVEVLLHVGVSLGNVKRAVR